MQAVACFVWWHYFAIFSLLSSRNGFGLSAKSVTKRDNPVKGKLIRRQKFTFQYLKKAIFVSKCGGHSLMDFFVRELLKKFLEMSFLRNWFDCGCECIKIIDFKNWVIITRCQNDFSSKIFF